MNENLEDEKDDDDLNDIKSEQKSLLIILGSLVGISLVVILGIFIFFPFNSSNEPTIIVEKQNNKTPVILEENNYIANLNTPQNSHPSEEDFFLEITPEGLSPAPIGTPPKTPVIKETEPSSIPAKIIKPEEPIIKKEEKKEITPAIKEPTKPVEAVETSKPVEKPQSNNSIKTTESSEIKTQSPITKNVFWIQIGSYSDEKLSNNTIEKLKVEGFEAQSFKYSSGDKTLNRVRMGPYETKSEASKFLNWIQELNGFQESYIVEAKA